MQMNITASNKIEMQINTIDITKACVTCHTTMNHKNASVSKV